MSILLVVEEPKLEWIAIWSLAENVSDNHIITFADQLTLARQSYSIEVRDDLGNKYAHHNPLGIAFVQSRFPGGGWYGGTVLRPKKFAFFIHHCTTPVENAKTLHGELPSHAIDCVEKFRFRIPIKRETVTFTALTDAGAGMNPKPVTCKVLFKRDDFQEWFTRANKEQYERHRSLAKDSLPHTEDEVQKFTKVHAQRQAGH
jgi:hypothetical protein